MGNRKLPFGYRMDFGKVVAQPEEAEVVRRIFDHYLAGMSFKEIATELEAMKAPYDEGRPWNKNIIARLLENGRYAGEKEHPAIIDPETFRSVRERRKGRQSPAQKTEADKVLRQLSGHSPTAKTAAQIRECLNFLIGNTDVIRRPSAPGGLEAMTCRRELEQTLTGFPIDEERAKGLVRRWAELEYQAIGSGEYETERLKRILSSAQPMKTLDAKLLKATVSAVTLKRGEVRSIRLKNNQVIEWGNQT